MANFFDKGTRWHCVVAALFFLCTLLAGCSREKIHGISLSLGQYERGLWYDHDEREYHPHGFGLKLDLVAGNMLRPLKNPLDGENPWKGGDDLGVLRGPIAGPFLSIALGPYGLYAGFKAFEVTASHGGDDRYGRWIHDDEVPPEGRTYLYLCPSATIRRTRWK